MIIEGDRVIVVRVHGTTRRPHALKDARSVKVVLHLTGSKPKGKRKILSVEVCSQNTIVARLDHHQPLKSEARGPHGKVVALLVKLDRLFVYIARAIAKLEPPPGNSTPFTCIRSASRTLERDSAYGIGTTRPPALSIHFTYDAARYVSSPGCVITATMGDDACVPRGTDDA